LLSFDKVAECRDGSKQKERCIDNCIRALEPDICNICYKWCPSLPSYIDREDIIQAARIGLYKAFKSPNFDPSKSRFDTYAINSMLNSMRTELKSAIKSQGTLFSEPNTQDLVEIVENLLFRKLNQDEVELLVGKTKLTVKKVVSAEQVELHAIASIDPTDLPTDIIGVLELTTAVELALNRLPSRCKDIIKYSIKGYTVKQISEALGLCEVTIFRYIKMYRKAIQRICKKLDYTLPDWVNKDVQDL